TVSNLEAAGFWRQDHSTAGQWQITQLRDHGREHGSVSFLNPNWKVGVYCRESSEFVSNPTVLAKGAVTKKLVRFEWIIFQKIGSEPFEIFSILFISKLAPELPDLLSPCYISLRRVPLRAAVQVRLDGRSSGKSPTDGSHCPGIEEYVRSGQDGGNGSQRLLESKGQVSTFTQIA